MAHHKSALKRIRQTARRTEVNRSRKSRVNNFINKVVSEINSGNKDQAKLALVKAESEIMKAVSKNVIKLKTASRKVSRLSKAVKAIS